MNFLFFLCTLLVTYFFVSSSVLAIEEEVINNRENIKKESLFGESSLKDDFASPIIEDKEHVMLIHGGWHASWCWEMVEPLLVKGNYTVYLPNLPGHGDHSCELGEVTLKKYVDYVIEQVSFINKPVNLVGHSMGGVVISQVADIIPEKIKSLTYISAFLLKNNESLMDAARLAEKPLHMEVTDNGLGVKVKEDTLVESFYHDCSMEVLSLYLPKVSIQTQAMEPSVTPIQISASRFGSVPRAYIECLKDRSLSIKMQREMQKNWPCKIVVSLETSHSPFFSAPIELANALDYVIKKMQEL